MTAYADGLDLTLTSRQRFIEAVNFKYSRFFIDVADRKDAITDVDYTKNAELIDIEGTTTVPYTGIAIYRIDVTANNVPYNYTVPEEKRYFNRRVPITQILASDIVEAYALNGVVWLNSESEDEIKTTHDLIPLLNAQLKGLTFVESDIVKHPVQEGTTCITIQFSPLSVNYKGAFRVDVMYGAK